MEVSSWEKNIYFYGPFSTAMFNNQRVYINITTWEIHKNTHTPTGSPRYVQVSWDTQQTFHTAMSHQINVSFHLTWGIGKEVHKCLGGLLLPISNVYIKTCLGCKTEWCWGWKKKYSPTFNNAAKFLSRQNFYWFVWRFSIWELAGLGGNPMSKHAQVQEQKLAWKVWPSWVTPTTQYMYRIDMLYHVMYIYIYILYVSIVM